MTDRELLLLIQRQIQQHCCVHRDQLIQILPDEGFELRICKWCGKILERKKLRKEPDERN